MAFEHLNYSTEERDETSIQDCIDHVHERVQNNLSALKSEVLSVFQSVTVHIFESGSSLNVRNRTGEIIGSLANETELQVLEDHIFGPNNKVFLHVQLPSGGEGYVSADYVVGNICPAPEIPEPLAPPVLPAEEPLEPLQYGPPERNGPRRSAPEIPEPLAPPVLPAEEPLEPLQYGPPERNGPRREIEEVHEENIEIVVTSLLGFITNGAMYIVGENGEPSLVTYSDFPEEGQDNIVALGVLGTKMENLILLIQALSIESPDSSIFGDIENDLLTLSQSMDITSTPQSLETEIQNLFDRLVDATTVNMGYGYTGSYLNGLDISNKFAVIRYIRDMVGNSELARTEIVRERFNLLGVSDEDLEIFISDPTADIASIRNIFGADIDGYIEFKRDINEKRAEANDFFIQNKEDIMAEYDIDEDTARELVIQSFLGNYTQSYLLREYIYHLPDTQGWSGYNGDDEYLELFSDIEGIGGNDWSDTTWNLFGEGAKILAMEAVAIGAGMLTMGVGTVAIHAAVWGHRGYRGIRALQGISRVANLGLRSGEASRLAIMSARALRFGTMGGIEGLTFGVGMGGAKTILEGENMYSGEMFLQSLGFTYAFRAMNTLYSVAGIRLNPEIPLSQQRITIGTQIIGDGIAFSTLGLHFEGVLLEPGEWSAETIIQAFFMASLFRGMGISIERYRFRKRENDVIVDEVPLLENPVIPPERRIPHESNQPQARTPQLENPVIPPNRRITYLREIPNGGLKEILFTNPRNNRDYIILGTPENIISVRLAEPASGGNGVLGGGARNIFIQNNERAILDALRTSPSLNNQSYRRFEYSLPEGQNGGGQTYEIFATQRSGEWGYHVSRISPNPSLPHSGGLGTAVLQDFHARYGDEILRILHSYT